MANTPVSDPTDDPTRPTRDSGTGPAATNLRHNEPVEPTLVAPGVLLGYARVSTRGQDTTRQVDALTAAGVESRHVFIDHGFSGGLRVDERPEQTRLMSHLRPGDTIVVHSLDRAGRRAADLLTWVEQIHDAGATLRILTLDVDTTSPMGRLVLGVVASLAEAERALIRERVQSGLEAARRRGRVGGRKPVLTEAQKEAALNLVAGGQTAREVAAILKCSERTIRRVIAAAQEDSPA